MSLLTEQVKRLRRLAQIEIVTEVEKELRNAADTIEELATKLAAANMERSTAYYNGGWIPCSFRNPTKEECRKFGNIFQVTINIDEPKTMLMNFIYQEAHGENTGEWIWISKPSPWEVVAWKTLSEPYKEVPHESNI